MKKPLIFDIRNENNDVPLKKLPQWQFTQKNKLIY